VRSALEIVRDPKYVQVGQRSAPAKSITHRVHAVSSAQKAEWLIEHLRRPEGPVLIFSRTKIGADKLARRLAAAGVKCVALHADRTMDQRRQAVEGFGRAIQGAGRHRHRGTRSRHRRHTTP
jgi:ATP-dependent RNA helicase RhlE